MGTKNNPGLYDCYEAAKDDEPMFTFLARDICAPPSILMWCLQRAKMIMDGKKPGSDIEKIEEAYECAKCMAIYKGEKDASCDPLIAQVEKAIATIQSIRSTEPGESENGAAGDEAGSSGAEGATEPLPDSAKGGFTVRAAGP